jgi:hypothetical protein
MAEEELTRQQVYYRTLPAQKKRHKFMMARVYYYRRKGTLPREHTLLAALCRERGVDVAKVVSGEVPLPD